MDKKISGHSNLVQRNSAIIDKDFAAYEAAKSRKKSKLTIDNLVKKTEELEKRFENLEGMLETILSILKDVKK